MSELFTGAAIKTHDPRVAKAFCDGMLHRTRGAAADFPITDNPFTAGRERENDVAWDAGWTHADDANGGALLALSCSMEVDQMVHLAAVSGAVFGTTAVAIIDVTFDGVIDPGLSGLAAGWVITGSVVGAMGPIISAVLLSPTIVRFTATTDEVAPNTITATYTAANGSYRLRRGLPLADDAVTSGAIPA